MEAKRTLSFEFFAPKTAAGQLTLGRTVGALEPLKPWRNVTVLIGRTPGLVAPAELGGGFGEIAELVGSRGSGQDREDEDHETTERNERDQ